MGNHVAHTASCDDVPWSRNPPIFCSREPLGQDNIFARLPWESPLFLEQLFCAIVHERPGRLANIQIYVCEIHCSVSILLSSHTATRMSLHCIANSEQKEMGWTCLCLHVLRQFHSAHKIVPSMLAFQITEMVAFVKTMSGQ